MNILHLEASNGWGGQEMRILKEAEGMRLRGHKIILGVVKRGALVEQAKKAKFTVYKLHFKRPYWIFTLFKLFWIIWKNKIDVVNTHSSLDAWIGGIAARLLRRKVIRTRHLSTAIKPGFNSRFVYGKLADFVVTTSSSILPMISEQSGKPPSLCQCVATGVDPEKISVKKGEKEAFREKYKILPTDFLVGMVCVMRSWKGIIDFLKAADLLREKTDIRWILIGGGHIQTYQEKAKDLKLDEVVTFTGHLDNPFPAIEALDLFALLSTANEGISQAILQAAYLEKPLLATGIGGLSEVCLDRVTGLVVPPHTPSEVAEKILELKENRALREELGKNGKKLVLEKFTHQKMVDSMEKIYDALCVET